jgi:hypothetical protein
MKKDVLINWISALNSGEYPQTRGALKNENGYCPFGVLCELSQLSEWKPELNSTKCQYFNQINYLPQQVRNWAGISKKEIGPLTSVIIVYNDELKKTFSEISDILKKKYKLNN